MNKYKIILAFAVSLNAYSVEKIEDKLDKLRIPSDRVTPLVSKDKLYVVNQRYSTLKNRHEISILGGNDFAAEGHLLTRQLGLSYQYHLNSKWSFGLRRTSYFNELSEAGKTLFENQSILSDTDFALSNTELFTSYNTVYGKVRFAKDNVLYFDQYVSLGLGKVDLKSGNQNMASIDLGLSFWIGKNFSFKTGLRNELYNQRQLMGEKSIHNAIGYLSFGYLFGGDKI